MTAEAFERAIKHGRMVALKIEGEEPIYCWPVVDTASNTLKPVYGVIAPSSGLYRAVTPADCIDPGGHTDAPPVA